MEQLAAGDSLGMRAARLWASRLRGLLAGTGAALLLPVAEAALVSHAPSTEQGHQQGLCDLEDNLHTARSCKIMSAGPACRV